MPSVPAGWGLQSLPAPLAGTALQAGACLVPTGGIHLTPVCAVNGLCSLGKSLPPLPTHSRSPRLGNALSLPCPGPRIAWSLLSPRASSEVGRMKHPPPHSVFAPISFGVPYACFCALDLQPKPMHVCSKSHYSQWGCDSQVNVARIAVQLDPLPHVAWSFVIEIQLPSPEQTRGCCWPVFSTGRQWQTVRQGSFSTLPGIEPK